MIALLITSKLLQTHLVELQLGTMLDNSGVLIRPEKSRVGNVS